MVTFVRAASLTNFSELFSELGGDPDAALRRAGLRPAVALARHALHMNQFAAGQVGDRCVSEQQLACREAGLDAFGLGYARAEEGDLETMARGRAGVAARAQVARDVPPFGLKLGMAAMIAWKHQRAGCQGLQGRGPGCGPGRRPTGRRQSCGRELPGMLQPEPPAGRGRQGGYEGLLGRGHALIVAA